MQLRDITTVQTLVSGLSVQKQEAWRKFIHLYGEPLKEFTRAFARIYGADESDADDAVQELFLSMVTGTSVYDRKRGSFRNWLMMRLKSMICDKARARQVRLRKEGEAAQMEAPPLPEAPAETVAASEASALREKLAARALTVALDACDARTREIFRAYALQNESAANVAQRFGISPNSVYQIRHRVLTMAKEALNLLPPEA